MKVVLTGSSQYQNKIALAFLLLCCLLAYWPLTFHVFSLKNDALNYFLPVRFQISESINNGHWPFWSPYFNLGYPLHADMQSGVWNPICMVVFAGRTLHAVYITVRNITLCVSELRRNVFFIALLSITCLCMYYWRPCIHALWFYQRLGPIFKLDQRRIFSSLCIFILLPYPERKSLETCPAVWFFYFPAIYLRLSGRFYIAYLSFGSNMHLAPGPAQI